jgi:hypothetical protein
MLKRMLIVVGILAVWVAGYWPVNWVMGGFAYKGSFTVVVWLVVWPMVVCFVVFFSYMVLSTLWAVWVWIKTGKWSPGGWL